MTADWRDNLSALPDFFGVCQERRISDTGETVLYRKTPLFVVWDYSASDPLLFSDEDGAWQVVYGHEGGPHKERFLL